MIKYIVIDVDGTLTDGGVYYDDTGNEIKKFNTKDGAGFLVANSVGLKTVILTGRECAATVRRMTELKATHLFQNVKNKREFLESFMMGEGIIKEEIGYIGDDVNDLDAMSLVGFIGCPADACNEVREMADYISDKAGGHGAVRDVIEHILRENGMWDKAVRDTYF